jgi:hypothetical protein
MATRDRRAGEGEGRRGARPADRAGAVVRVGRITGGRTARRFAAAGAFAAGTAATATACDPCAGVMSCAQSPRLGVSGQIVDRGTPRDDDREQQSGAGIPRLRPAAGVRVEVVRVAGTELDAPSGAATTDATGWWQVSLPARDVGGITVDVIVTPPGGTPYRVRELNIVTSRTRGVGTVVGRWTREPFMTYVGEVYDAETGAAVDGAQVTAVRRGGVEVAPTANTRVPMVTFSGGRFLYEVRPLADGPLVADFVVERPGRPPATVPNVTLRAKHEWLPPNVDGELVFVLDAAGGRVNR